MIRSEHTAAHQKLQRADVLQQEWPFDAKLHIRVRGRGVVGNEENSALMWTNTLKELDSCEDEKTAQTGAVDGLRLWQRRSAMTGLLLLVIIVFVSLQSFDGTLFIVIVLGDLNFMLNCFSFSYYRGQIKVHMPEIPLKSL